MQKATTDFPSLAKYIFFTKVVIYLSEAKWASVENSSLLDNEVKQDKAWQIKAAPVAWVWVLTYRPRQSPENPRVSWLATTKGPSGYWQLERDRPWWDRRWSTTTAIEESCTGVGRKVAGLNLGADQEFFLPRNLRWWSPTIFYHLQSPQDFSHVWDV